MVRQIFGLFVLAIPVATVTWTFTKEELFRDLCEWFSRQSQAAECAAVRNFFYLFTCEFCFSHYVAFAFLAISRTRLMATGFAGCLIAFFTLVGIANLYMSGYRILRLIIRNLASKSSLRSPTPRSGVRAGF